MLRGWLSVILTLFVVYIRLDHTLNQVARMGNNDPG